MSEYKVRVRGIYATALAHILLEKGFELADVSQVLSSRLGVERNPVPPDVTVKNLDEDPDQIMVIGDPEAAASVVSALSDEVPSVIVREIVPGPYSVLKVRVLGGGNGKFSVETPYGQADMVSNKSLEPGSLVLAYVSRPGDRLLLREGVAAVTSTVIVERGRGGVRISEHIKSPEKIKALLRLAAEAPKSKEYGVRWRSGAGLADAEKLRADLSAALRRIALIEQLASQFSEPALVSEGERLYVGYVPVEAKTMMDDIRSARAATTPLHHAMKTWKNVCQQLVDVLDSMAAGGCRSQAMEAVLDFLLSQLRSKGRLRIEHLKPDGSRVILGQAEIKEARLAGDSIRLTLQRKVSSPGVYDGLRIAKEPGDLIITRVDTSSMTMIHEYYSATGNLKGVYANISTRPELKPEGAIRYVDLYADVIKLPGSKPKIIDMEELEKAGAHGLLPSFWVKLAKKEAERALRMLAENYP